MPAGFLSTMVLLFALSSLAWAAQAQLQLYDRAAALSANSNASTAIEYDGDNQRFTLKGNNVAYIFRVDNSSGELIHEHYGAVADFSGPIQTVVDPTRTGWSTNLTKIQRELPDTGRGDFRQPAYRVRNNDLNHSISFLQYASHDILSGKQDLPGLPSSFGSDDEVSTLLVYLADNFSGLKATLAYSIFPDCNAIARSTTFRNEGNYSLSLRVADSFAVDLPPGDLDAMWLGGDWASENQIYRSKVQHGTTSITSQTGFSSHEHNPFFAILDSSTTENFGESWGFALMYTGNWEGIIERNPYKLTRTLLGINRQEFEWDLSPGANFTTPEAISVYSDQGIGQMSRSYHDMYRNHISRSQWTNKRRPNLVNSWEANGFDFNASILYELAKNASEIVCRFFYTGLANANEGVELLVCDDGWFGKSPYARDNDSQGLGDWFVQPSKFPDGLDGFANQIKALNQSFGLWFELEMVNPRSYLYDAHPDWPQQAKGYALTEARNQLLLNLALPEVQDFIIDTLSGFLQNGTIKYVKWDFNRGMHEYTGASTPHAHILGTYRVYDILSARFPDVLFEGCASGGGRFDLGILHYFPQFWTSDDTDAVERIRIQQGTSLVHSPSAQGCHVSITPNQQTGRNTSIEFRSHVASMCGSYGFELNYGELPAEDRAKLPGLVQLQQQVLDTVRLGDLYILARIEDSNYPANLWVSKDQSKAVLFAFQILQHPLNESPRIKVPGLSQDANYQLVDSREIAPNATYSANYLRNHGLVVDLTGDFNSTIIQMTRV